jgi:hypothetical protein
MAIEAGELEIIGQLKSLKGLALTDGFSSSVWGRRLTVITQLFLNCSHLEFVDIEQPYYERSLQLYEHWEFVRTSSTPFMRGLLERQVVCPRFTDV